MRRPRTLNHIFVWKIPWLQRLLQCFPVNTLLCDFRRDGHRMVFVTRPIVSVRIDVWIAHHGSSDRIKAMD
jgi:hypothetical protein